MNRCLETNLEVAEKHARCSDTWKGRTVLESCMPASPTLNARAVEFISKPNKIRELRDCLRGPVISFLNQQPGFYCALLLTSHKEPRLVLVLSLWQTEREAAHTRWEDTFEIRRSVSPFVDACSRVHTYEVALSATGNGAEWRGC